MTIKANLVILSLLSVYQKTLSPDHGPLRSSGQCRFFPTCSDYAKHACMRYGAVRGTFCALGRLLRCHPWSRGGVDYIA